MPVTAYETVQRAGVIVNWSSSKRIPVPVNLSESLLLALFCCRCLFGAFAVGQHWIALRETLSWDTVRIHASVSCGNINV